MILNVFADHPVSHYRIAYVRVRASFGLCRKSFRRRRVGHCRTGPRRKGSDPHNNSPLIDVSADRTIITTRFRQWRKDSDNNCFRGGNGGGGGDYDSIIRQDEKPKRVTGIGLKRYIGGGKHGKQI